MPAVSEVFFLFFFPPNTSSSHSSLHRCALMVPASFHFPCSVSSEGWPSMLHSPSFLLTFFFFSPLLSGSQQSHDESQFSQAFSAGCDFSTSQININHLSEYNSQGNCQCMIPKSFKQICPCGDQDFSFHSSLFKSNLFFCFFLLFPEIMRVWRFICMLLALPTFNVCSLFIYLFGTRKCQNRH